jgi:hypothetical protein
LRYTPRGATLIYMTTMEQHDVDRPRLSQTPSGWLAVGDDFPRIGVMAPTREEAERLFRTERQAWRELATR